VYFVSAAPALRVKVTGNLAENTSTKIIGMIPALAAGQWRVEAVTQYAGGTPLKEPRVIHSEQELTAG
jgi:hypothetical protein